VLLPQLSSPLNQLLTVYTNITITTKIQSVLNYGFGLGKNAVLRGYYDVMNDCANRPYLPTNVTGAIKNFTSLQQVNDCDSGYDDGWNKYCHMGLAKHPDIAASCPISGPKTETSQY
jgi:hypothetical protein